MNKKLFLIVYIFSLILFYVPSSLGQEDILEKTLVCDEFDKCWYEYDLDKGNNDIIFTGDKDNPSIDFEGDLLNFPFDSALSVLDDGEKIIISYADSNIFVHSNDAYNGVEFDYQLLFNTGNNKFIFPFTQSGLTFYYQDKLSAENPEMECTNTECFEDGVLILSRPENVVGSYAVFNGEQKVFHIYRPLVTDNIGDTIWGELFISDNELIVVVNQDWLDTAIYPVLIDPIVGYSTQGASSDGSVESFVSGGWFINNATIKNLSWYGSVDSSLDILSIVIHRFNVSNPSDPAELLVSTNLGNSTSFTTTSWHDHVFSPSLNLSGSHNIFFGIVVSNSGNAVFYDSATGFNYSESGYNFINNPFYNGTAVSQSNNRKASIYIGYDNFLNDTTKPFLLQNLSNQSTLNNTLPIYDVNASDNMGVDVYTLNNSVEFNITRITGIIQVITRIPGNYTLNISINDTSNNVLTDLFTWEINKFVIPIPSNKVSLDLPICGLQVTISNNTNKDVYFNWTNTSATNYSFRFNNVLLSTSTNNFFNLTNINTTTYSNGFYYWNVTANYPSVSNITNSYPSCTLNLCVNNWIETFSACVMDEKQRLYVDDNSCNEGYNIPLNNGSFVSGCTPPLLNIESTLIIYLLLAVFLFAVGIYVPILLIIDGIYITLVTLQVIYPIITNILILVGGLVLAIGCVVLGFTLMSKKLEL